jgi:hypothetical protein
MKLSTIDTTKLIGFAIGALSLLTAATLHQLLPAASSTLLQSIAAWIGIVASFLTLAYSTLTRQTPDGVHVVYSPTEVPDVATLTTTAEIKKT